MKRAANTQGRAWKNAQRGISLLEVLISMFVLLVGLLSVAALIPVGRFEVQRGMNADLGAACGRAAFRELKVRSMLNPGNWALMDGKSVYDLGQPLNRFSFDGGHAFGGLRSVVIDPLGMLDGTDDGSRSFPFDASETPPMVPTGARLPRLTFDPTIASGAARQAIAETIFRSQDELIFERSTNGDSLPTQILEKGLRRLYEGNYTWLATVVPDPNLVNPDNVFDIPCCVSVAVFLRRNLTRAGVDERICSLVDTGAIVPDEVRLTVTAAGVAPQYVGNGEGAAHLSVRPGHWLLLAADTGTEGASIWHYAWHRVASVDDIVDSGGYAVSTIAPGTGPWFRNVTLIGAFTAPGSTFSRANIVVFLFDDIIGVYEKNMKLQRY